MENDAGVEKEEHLREWHLIVLREHVGGCDFAFHTVRRCFRVAIYNIGIGQDLFINFRKKKEAYLLFEYAKKYILKQL